MEFEQIQDELSFLGNYNEFMDFYNYYCKVITYGNSQDDDYEMLIIKRRGIQFTYLEEIDELSRDIGVDMTREKERYRQIFEESQVVSFAALLEEVEDGLSFIKSNKINTYEMLYDANEMIKQAEEAEAENDKLAIQAALENPVSEDVHDTEAEALLDDPEEMIKLLKKRRGI